MIPCDGLASHPKCFSAYVQFSWDRLQIQCNSEQDNVDTEDESLNVDKLGWYISHFISYQSPFKDFERKCMFADISSLYLSFTC